MKMEIVPIRNINDVMGISLTSWSAFFFSPLHVVRRRISTPSEEKINKKAKGKFLASTGRLFVSLPSLFPLEGLTRRCKMAA